MRSSLPSTTLSTPPRDAWLLPILKELLPPALYKTLTSSTHESYWRATVQMELISESQLLAEVARRCGIPVAQTLNGSDDLKQIVNERTARTYHVMPLHATATSIAIATANPYDITAEHMIGFATGRHVQLHLATPSQIERAIQRLYRSLASIDTILKHLTPANTSLLPALAEEPPPFPDSDSDGHRPIISLVDHLITDAITLRASDLHIEPEELGVAVRYRIDGVLSTRVVLPAGVGPPLVSRIKIMAQMDIADRLRPQGGRARVRAPHGEDIDLRVSTLPAAHGEKVVIRILDPSTALQTMDSLGFDPDSAYRLQKLLDIREGLILITGPTGSGKTTTLYAALQQLLKRKLNIITVEDPVEYRVPGLVQVQTNEKAGLTFASALRSILRQDPDVILIGEVRDQETANIAIQASLTGHLVFATLHTLDASSSIVRLQDLGVDPTKVATALKGVIAQRLLRRVCQQCVQQAVQQVPPVLWDVVPAGAKLPVATGCQRCNESGYLGRLAAAEVILVNSALETLIGAGTPAKAIGVAARQYGMASLWESGISHLLARRTTLEEVRRVLDVEELAFPGVPGEEET